MASSPALYAATNCFVPVSSWPASSSTYAWYCSLAASTCFCTTAEALLFSPDFVTVNVLRMPLPVMPGLQAGTYFPAGALTTRLRDRPGPMFSASPMIRLPSAAYR